jgi:hypothetical protein
MKELRKVEMAKVEWRWEEQMSREKVGNMYLNRVQEKER